MDDGMMEVDTLHAAITQTQMHSDWRSFALIKQQSTCGNSTMSDCFNSMFLAVRSPTAVARQHHYHQRSAILIQEVLSPWRYVCAA